MNRIFSQIFIFIFLPLFMVACGSTTSKPDTSSSKSNRGGYYKDDGPDDVPPQDLDKIPDATPKNEPVYAASTRPYTALGQRYVPMKTRKPFTQRGMASWYGKKFHGAKTATGERYDMYAMTAAHPTLPLPSYVRVTNVENGRSVVVRVNDRGPFHSSRIIDLSYTAAWKLGYINKGSTLVSIELLLPNQKPNQKSDAPIASQISSIQDDPTPPTTPQQGIFLQLGTFSSDRNAEDFKASAQSELAWLKYPLLIQNEQGNFRLRIGPFDSVQAAREMAQRITQNSQLKPFVVQR